MYLYRIIMKDSERHEGSTSLCFILCSFLFVEGMSAWVH